jgi:AcrR family transcriptional regulator
MEAAQSRWHRRKDARPAEILEAALTVFAEKGFAAARMEDISHRAGVTKGTIYLYFDSKEALFKALISQSISPAIADAREQVNNFRGTAGDLLRLVLTRIGHFIATSDRVVLPKIIVAEAGNFPELARFYRNEIIAQGLGLLTGLVARGVASGEFRAVDSGHVARISIAPLLLAAFWRTSFAQFDDEPYDHAGMIETHIGLLLAGLSAGG